MNLLPWRDAYRQYARRRAYGVFIVGLVLVGGVIAGIALPLREEITRYREENARLAAVEAPLPQQVQKGPSTAVAMQIQEDHRAIHFLEQLPGALPDPLYFTLCVRKDRQIWLDGWGASTKDIAFFLAQIQALDSVARADLQEIRTMASVEAYPIAFQIRVLLKAAEGKEAVGE